MSDLENKYQTHWQLGEYKEAIESIDRILEECPHDISTDSRISRIVYNALISKCLLLNEVGRFNDTIALCDILLEKNSNTTELGVKGAALSGLGRYEEAIIWLNRALARNPSNVAALTFKGLVLSKIGEYQNAIKFLDKALLDGHIAIFKHELLSNFIRSQTKDSISLINKQLEFDPYNQILIELKKKLKNIIGC